MTDLDTLARAIAAVARRRIESARGDWDGPPAYPLDPVGLDRSRMQRRGARRLWRLFAWDG